ncbi:MAG TPA: hypothetical protein DEP23_08515 [Ruminococcaceae bacterium]|nr:hypothetical protein [Oscillospiraceae bacterium]
MIQSGGNTLKDATLKILGLTKQQGKYAIEALKDDCGLRNDAHFKIWENGDVLNPDTGAVLGNLYDFVQ